MGERFKCDIGDRHFYSLIALTFEIIKFNVIGLLQKLSGYNENVYRINYVFPVGTKP